MKATPEIIHEDDLIFVIDKPAGMPSASLKGDERGTVAAWLKDNFPEQSRIDRGMLEAGLCHRIDNDTSGLLVAARTDEAYESLRAQFNAGEVKKEYRALVIGTPPEDGIIDAPIAHHPRKKSKMVACDSKALAVEWKGRPAVTRFKAMARYEFASSKGGAHAARYTLLDVTIDTGVRHQIRVHLAHIGHPLAGDKLYRNPAKRAADPLPLNRHFLHCMRLSFIHPATGKEVSFESTLPEDLAKTLSRLVMRRIDTRV
ncbi:MAG: RluA family pseudouridine synthase [bacterium]